MIIEVDNYQELIGTIVANGRRVVKVAEPYEGAPVYNVVMVETENNQLTASQMVTPK